MMTDPISDFLTRIRNAIMRQKTDVCIPKSRLKVSIAELLQKEGLIRGYSEENDEIKIELKYTATGEPVLHDLKRVSKPGCRIYSGASDIPKLKSGMGFYILSTSRGLMTDRHARRENIGGEILCSIY